MKPMPADKDEIVAESALDSFYAEEVRRALSWREAMERTRDLSVVIVAGMAFIAFGLTGSTHLVLFLGSLAIFALLIFEARMFRFSELSEQRLRQIEENYFAPALDPALTPVSNWREVLAKSLVSTEPAVGFIEAFATRIARNYFIIFLALDVCWFSKLYLDPTPATSWSAFEHRADLGILPGWAVLLVVVPVWGSYIALIIWLWLKNKYLGRVARY
jgi:uncharacterized membrane protein